MAGLSDSLNGAVESMPLPLFHNTSSFNFRTVSQADPSALTPYDCPVFSDRLLYLFYGRPAFRVADEDSDLLAYAPICFLLKPDALTSVTRVFPFDTGAFEKELYQPFIHSGMTRADFELGTDLASARRAVTAFFGSPREYFVGRLSSGLSARFSEMELDAYINIVRRPPASLVDDRRYTIEVQTSSSIPLLGNTLAVALPYEAMEDASVHKFVVNRLRAQPIPYLTFSGVRPSDYHMAILQAVHGYLKTGGYL